MNCAVHSNAEATGFCRNCGKALCGECARAVGGALYCESCLAARVAAPAIPAAPATGSNPGLAVFLGFIPGLGAVYNAQYMKAAIHVLIFGGLVAALSSDLPDGVSAFLGIALGAFVCYMPLDAYRTAKARMLGEPEPPNPLDGPGQKPIGAFVLIGIGALLLMSNFGWLQRDWFEKSWPVALIVIGGWLLWDRMKPAA
jgi:LiaI-LiaF-like transmembrane region/B-box zinc finger